MSNSKSVLGVIGGSGVYEIDGLQNQRWKKVYSLLESHLMSYFLEN